MRMQPRPWHKPSSSRIFPTAGVWTIIAKDRGSSLLQRLYTTPLTPMDYILGYRVPNGSRIITSDDIFDYMLTVRTNNEEIGENKEVAKRDWSRLKYGDSIKISGMQDYEQLRLQVMARQKSTTRRQFIRKTVGDEVKLNSNGETALQYF